MNFSVFTENKRIRSADEFGPICDKISKLQHRFFMGERDVQPDKPHLRQHLNSAFKILRRDIHRDVVPFDRIFA